MSGPRTDVAALAAAVTAVSVSMMVAEGPFDLLGAVIAVSLGVMVIAYMPSGLHRPLQILAFGCVFGLLAIPIAGFIGDSALCTPRDSRDSGVPDWALAAVWLGAVVLTVGLNGINRKSGSS
jgi:hypothetical protein